MPVELMNETKVSKVTRRTIEEGGLFLAEQLSNLAKHPVEDVQIYCGYSYLRGIDVIELNFMGPDHRGGSCIQNMQENLGLLSACREVLLHYNVEPERPEGWESDLDLRAEAIDNLKYWWKKGE